MRKWETGLQRIHNGVSQITQSAIQTSRTWGLSSVSGWQSTKASQEREACLTEKPVKICSQRGVRGVMSSAVIPAQR